MFRFAPLLNSPYQGIAPIISRPLPIPLALARLGKALREVCSWKKPEDVYDPTRNFETGHLGPELVVGAAPEWSGQEHRHLMEAFVLPLDTESLFADFAQTDEGNCALVATVKAAMRKFGSRLFPSVKMPGKDRFRVRLRDGAEVTLEREELALTRESSRLKGPDSPTKAFAIFSYAVAAARRAQLTPAVDFKAGLVEGWLSERERFERALQDLRSGHRPHHCATYLGVGHEMRVHELGSDEELLDDSTVVSSRGHAVYVQRVDGEVKADHYGEAVSYDGTDTNGRPSRERFTFEGQGLKDVDGWFYI